MGRVEVRIEPSARSLIFTWLQVREGVLSFKVSCESLDPYRGIARIWLSHRALSSRSEATRNNVLTDPDSPVFWSLQDELVRGDVPPSDAPVYRNVLSGGRGGRGFR